MRLDSIPVDPLETVVANSFRNFHAKGLDYLCLLRSPSLTIKAYFYDNPNSTNPDVVCPHDHRYPFTTTIVAGKSRHHRYRVLPAFLHPGAVHQRFAWSTPLNGGAGFSWAEEAHLERTSTERYRAGETYFCRADEIHTIAITEPGTCLLLYQLADVLPIGEPTSTFVSGCNKEPPSLSGLYDRMTEDRALELLRALTPERTNHDN